MIGTLSVALIAYVGWLLFRSMTVATIAALLAAVDGLMLVESRLALLDIFPDVLDSRDFYVSGA